MNWDPQQYNKFKLERARPFFDLLNMIERSKPITSAVDLGCGTGELTAHLASELKTESVLGLDNSEAMLTESSKYTRRGLTFSLQSIADFAPKDPFDLVFTNAALQWLPDHESLFPKVLGWVKSGGQVACQMPFNFGHPSHRIAQDLACEMFPRAFPQEQRRSVLSLERYAEILFDNGFKRQICKIEVYGIAMPSGLDVIEWTKGTLLNGFTSRLSVGEFNLFLQEYKRRLIGQIGEGPYYYAFKRALLWGVRS